MKKIVLICAAVMAAVSVRAAVTVMTCEEAANAALLLPAGDTGTDSVSVTGFVTKLAGDVSSRDGKPQQRFYMDDEKGSGKQTMQIYWGNLPDETPLVLGDKVTAKGLLMNYNSTAEMKNPDIIVVSRTTVQRDTIEATVCEVIEEGEGLNNDDMTDDYFETEGYVAILEKTDSAHFQQTFYLVCDDNDKQLQAYNCITQEDKIVGLDDKVRVVGRVTNFQGTKIEIANGKVWLVEKASEYVPKTYSVSIAQAITAGQALGKNFVSRDYYKVSGYVDSIASPYSSEFNNISFFICADMSNLKYDFEVYRCAATEAAQTEIVKGAYVTVTGKLKRFVKTENNQEVELIELVEGSYKLSNPTALEGLKGSATAEKRVENGQIIILKEGVKYNLLGTEIK